MKTKYSLGPPNEAEKIIYAQERLRVNSQHIIQKKLNELDMTRKNLSDKLGWTLKKLNRKLSDNGDLTLIEFAATAFHLGIEIEIR